MRSLRPGSEVVSVHFGELWLKGGNRHEFIKSLQNNLAVALSGSGAGTIELMRDRIMVHMKKDSDYAMISERISKVFGVSWFGRSVVSRSTIPSIIKSANALAGNGDTIRIEAHRSSKDLKFDSPGLLSAFIKHAGTLSFKLDIASEDIITINAGKEMTFLTRGRLRGANGLPVGSSGIGVSLLSGGIDSPVASWYAMKRGIRPIYLHVHGFGSNDAQELKKLIDTVSVLSRYSGLSRIYFAPFHIFQSMSMRTDRKYETVLFKRFLYLLAESVAAKERADCIITGESLGQVASQTIKNLSATSSGIDEFVVRPLIGFDKQEIIDVAKSIGTMDLSVQKYRDVCSIDLKRVVLNASSERVAELSERMDLKSAVAATLARTSYIDVSAAWK